MSGEPQKPVSEPLYVYAVSYIYSGGMGQLRVLCAEPLNTWREFKRLPETIVKSLQAQGSPLVVPTDLVVLMVLPLVGDWR
jgi:hypothetical protein